MGDMTTQRGTAATVGRTVWLLGQMRGHTTKLALADALGFSRRKLYRLLDLEQQWTLEDLEQAAEALGLSGPGDLFRPLAELVGAVDSAEEVTRDVTLGYPPASSHPNVRLAQVIPFRPSYRSVTSSSTTPVAPVTWLGASRGGQLANPA